MQLIIKSLNAKHACFKIGASTVWFGDINDAAFSVHRCSTLTDILFQVVL